MSNGKMLEVIKQYTDAGKEIPDELFKSLMVQNAVDSNNARMKLHDVVEECKDAIDCLDHSGCEQSERNLMEINRLRSRNTFSDIITAALIGLAGFLGYKN